MRRRPPKVVNEHYFSFYGAEWIWFFGMVFFILSLIPLGLPIDSECVSSTSYEPSPPYTELNEVSNYCETAFDVYVKPYWVLLAIIAYLVTELLAILMCVKTNSKLQTTGDALLLKFIMLPFAGMILLFGLLLFNVIKYLVTFITVKVLLQIGTVALLIVGAVGLLLLIGWINKVFINALVERQRMKK